MPLIVLHVLIDSVQTMIIVLQIMIVQHFNMDV